MDYIMILSTVENEKDAQTISHALVSGKLAACVNIIPGVQSVYQWKGKIARESECLLMIKTTGEREKEIYAEILNLHPYDTPEIISIPIQKGENNYLNWLTEIVQ